MFGFWKNRKPTIPAHTLGGLLAEMILDSGIRRADEQAARDFDLPNDDYLRYTLFLRTFAIDVVVDIAISVPLRDLLMPAFYIRLKSDVRWSDISTVLQHRLKAYQSAHSRPHPEWGPLWTVADTFSNLCGVSQSFMMVSNGMAIYGDFVVRMSECVSGVTVTSA